MANLMDSIPRRYLRNTLLVVGGILVVAEILYGVCWGYAWIRNKMDDTVVIDGKETPKVVLADACNHSGTQCINDVVLVKGRINGGSVSALERFMAGRLNQPVKFICFDSGGGDVDYAYDISTRIRKSNLGTCLAERYIIKGGKEKPLYSPQCGSACNFLLLSSANRVAIGRDFRVISHAAANTVHLCCGDIKVDERPDRQMELFDKFVNYPENTDTVKHISFINFAGTIPNHSKHILTEGELIKYAIFNKRMN